MIKLNAALQLSSIVPNLENDCSSRWQCYSRGIAAGGAISVSSYPEDFDNNVTWKTGEMVGDPVTDEDGGHIHMLDITQDGSHYHIVTGITTDTDGEHYHYGSSANYVDDHVHIMGKHEHFQNLIPHTHLMVLPNHDHDTIFGIFEGSTPTAVTVEVDGNVIPGLGINEDSIDLIPYLSKDGDGKIQRGRWVDIEITPNNLGRIVATVNTQIFVNSRGGGNH
ncbi:MAG: hypothetical protein K6T85_07770 [Gorillibacterium sp.]|nr:hypothetical protein [Gorillibacterium sp.]